LAIIGLLSNSGANIDLMKLDGDAALHIAIYKADNDAVKILLQNGADPNLLQQSSRQRSSRDDSPHHPTLTRYNSYQPRRSAHLDLPSLESYRPDSLKHKSNNKYKGIPRTPLCLAIDNSNLAIVNLLLESGANPNLTPPGHADPLLKAVASGLEGIVSALLRKGADASSATGNTSLGEAIKLGHVAIVALLLEHGAKVNPPQTNSLAGTPLHLAIRRCTIDTVESVEWYDIVKILLQEGANPNLLDNDGMSPLHLAIVKGLPKVVEVLVENGADAELQIGQAPNAAGHIYLTQSDQSLLTPLQLAIDPGATSKPEHRPSALGIFSAKTKKMDASESTSRVTNEDIVDILLEGGANPNTNLKDQKDSPMERARASGNSRVVRALLSHGAEILTQRGDLAGKWALFYLWENEEKPKRGSRLQMRRCALSKSRVGIAQAFIDCGGADVHAKNRDNQTILHVAAKKKCVSMVKFCLKKGVDVTAKDKHGRIARQYALDTEMINLFVVDQPTNTDLLEATDYKDRKQARSPRATRISRPKKGKVSGDSLQ
jgi:ankyrin repeat protein